MSRMVRVSLVVRKLGLFGFVNVYCVLLIASQSVVRKTEQHHTLYSHHLLDELFQYFRVYNNMIGFHMT